MLKARDRSLHFASIVKILAVMQLLCVALTSPITAMAGAGQLDKSFGRSGIFLGKNAGLGNTGPPLWRSRLMATSWSSASLTDWWPRCASLPTARSITLWQRRADDCESGTRGGFSALGVVVQSDGKTVLAIANLGADDAPVLELCRLNQTVQRTVSSESTGH